MRFRKIETWQYLSRIVNEILNTDGSTNVVAISFSIGTFLALLPTLGSGAFIGLLILLIFPSLHKPSLLSAFIIWNPIVQIPLYSLSIIIGSILFSGMPVVSFDIELIDHVYKVTRRVLVGNLIVSSFISLFSYLTVFVMIKALKKKPVFKTELN